jgi:NADH-quinone oxidoreductase subunit M
LIHDISVPFENVAILLALIGIFYGALTAFAQPDFKKLIAYSSISHLSFVLLGIFAGTQTALEGAVVIMIAHGLSTGALFVIAGIIRQKTGTTDMTRMSGLWTLMPRMGGMTMLFALASLGLPGFANFVGEFLVLLGTFKVYPWYAGIAVFGFVFSAIYSLYFIYRLFQGPSERSWNLSDLKFEEMLNLSILAAGLFWIGIFPQTVLDTSKSALQKSTNLQDNTVNAKLTGDIQKVVLPSDNK